MLLARVLVNVVRTIRASESTASSRARCSRTTVLPVPAPPVRRKRTLVGACRVRALLRMQEHAPCSEVTALDDSAKFLIIFDET